eukprot:547410_1
MVLLQLIIIYTCGCIVFSMRIKVLGQSDENSNGSDLLILFIRVILVVCAYCVFDIQKPECILPKCKKDAPIVQYDINNYNPNEDIESVIQIFKDFKPTKENKDKYFSELVIIKNKQNVDIITDSIAVIVPFYNEKASEIHATLRSLCKNFEFIQKNNSKHKFTHFHVLLIGDGWFKTDISTRRYLRKLYPKIFNDNNLDNFIKDNINNTVVLQTKSNKKLCINPFKNSEKKLFLPVTTIIKIDNR